jgi:hypothetical protein
MKGTAMHRAPAPRILATTATAAVATAALVASVGVPAVGIPATAPAPRITSLPAAATGPASGSSAAAVDATAAVDAHSNTITDADLDGLIALLESLPADLQSADPRTTPDYEQRLARALDRAAEEQRLGPTARQVTARTTLLLGAARPATALTPASPLAPGARLAVDWWACTAAVAGAIVQYAVPVAKVVGWLREARALWGGVLGVLHAIRRGVAAIQIGEEGAQVLFNLLGVGGVVANCFGARAVAA